MSPGGRKGEAAWALRGSRERSTRKEGEGGGQRTAPLCQTDEEGEEGAGERQGLNGEIETKGKKKKTDGELKDRKMEKAAEAPAKINTGPKRDRREGEIGTCLVAQWPRPYFQIKSHSEVSGVRASTYEF